MIISNLGIGRLNKFRLPGLFHFSNQHTFHTLIYLHYNKLHCVYMGLTLFNIVYLYLKCFFQLWSIVLMLYECNFFFRWRININIRERERATYFSKKAQLQLPRRDVISGIPRGRDGFYQERTTLTFLVLLGPILAVRLESTKTHTIKQPSKTATKRKHLEIKV